MKKQDKFLTFITACIPGVGYMYNGLMTKGIEALIIFIFINVFFNLLEMHFIGGIVEFLFWCYTFFDSLKIADSIEKGESVSDSNFIFENESFKSNFTSDTGKRKRNWLYLGWGLIILGVLSLINKIFINNEFYMYIRENINRYSLPIFLIAIGCFLLFRKK